MEAVLQENISNQPALHQLHVDNAARLVSFSGLNLPLHYGSALGEHQAVRESAGMFDLSHLHQLDLRGYGVTQWLRKLLTNDVARLSDGQGLYSCLCKEDGGVVDDLLVFRLTEDHYRLSIDLARREKDMAWFEAHLTPDVDITDVSGVTMIAVQGPDAVFLAGAAMQSMGVSMQLADMPRFSMASNGEWNVSRTGYTGEDGLEITLPESQAADLWRALAEQGVAPVGLAARDTLRLEAGFGLYGQDIDENHSPAESGIAHTINISDEDRQFIGREILEDHKLFSGRCFQIGLVLDGNGLMRRGARVELAGETIGTISSGGYSPIKAASVAMARVNRTFIGSCDVAVRDRLQPAHITSLPFVPHGLARE